MADFANYTPGEYAKEHIRITPTTLADGRDFFYLDDDPEFVSGAKTRELKDPRVSGVMLSVVRVEVTNDLSYCTVYVSAMEGMDAAKNAVKGLKSAAGFVRRELGARLKLRHVPELIFKATDSIEYGANIARILHDLEKEERQEETENEN